MNIYVAFIGYVKTKTDSAFYTENRSSGLCSPRIRLTKEHPSVSLIVAKDYCISDDPSKDAEILFSTEDDSREKWHNKRVSAKNTQWTIVPPSVVHTTRAPFTLLYRMNQVEESNGEEYKLDMMIISNAK